MTQQLLNLEDITVPDISNLVIEDDTPVDNFQSEKQQRLLVDALYSSWSPDTPFIAAANVGLFYALKHDPLVPDAFLSLGGTELGYPVFRCCKCKRAFNKIPLSVTIY